MLRLASSQFFIPRDSDFFDQMFRRVRLMPLYSMPHIKDLDLNCKDNTRSIFFHMDIDAFFAQAEERDNPRYKGMPISVGGWGNYGGIVMTCNYEARKYGVETGMSVVQAKVICPHLVSLPCDGQKYESIIYEIQQMVKQYLPEDQMEQYSIDECFWKGTGIFKNIDEAEKFAIKIKKEIYKYQKLTCSIGLSYNKSYAKMATKFNKPNGLTVIRPENREKMIDKLPCDKLWGIARRMTIRMNAMGIVTLKDLAECNSLKIRKEFGINGIVLQKCASGLDTSDIFVKPLDSEKMIGHHHTMKQDIYDEDKVMLEIRDRCEYAARKMRSKKKVTGRISLYIGFDNTAHTGGQYKLPFFTNDDDEIFSAACEIYKRLTHKPHQNMQMRMSGIDCGDLHFDTGERNLKLFEKEKNLPFKELDFLKMKYGEDIIRLGLAS